jgi:gamma-glutamylcyclotransferase (GGCT)/AIG2-like uncharacterized protein YtfP
MAMPVKHVLVYGTLMREMDNHHLIAPYTKTVTPGWVSGGQLYHLEYGYPALILNGDTAVQGEIVEITDMADALPVLDHLEGYHSEGCPTNLYDRIVCQAQTADGKMVEVYVYVWTHSEQLSTIGCLVADGCWRSFMARCPDDVPDRYYFAYGSCMDLDGRIADSGYKEDFRPIGTACLEGWKFRLNKASGDGRVVSANIETKPGGKVYGVLYKITGRAEKEYLNRREGYPYHYYKEYLDVAVGEQIFPSAIVYIAQPAYLTEGLAITPAYEQELKRGGQHLPAAYREEFLQEVDTCARRRK